MAYLNSFKIKTKQNNSKRPVDALAEKHISPTDNLNSRDASASKNCPDLANIEFKIASHPSTYPINALLTPRFLLH